MTSCPDPAPVPNDPPAPATIPAPVARPVYRLGEGGGLPGYVLCDPEVAR
jgi:hypothetical protein